MIDQQRTNLAEVEYLDLDNVAKIVKTFENPEETGEKSEDYGIDGGEEGWMAEEPGVEYRFRESETGDIWNDGSLSLEERITMAALRLSQRHAGDSGLRNGAMRAITEKLQEQLCYCR